MFNGKGYHISGIFMIAFLLGTAGLAGQSVWHSRDKAVPEDVQRFLDGKWAALYEKQFNKNLLSYDFAVDGWGLLNYAAFHEGNEGVLVGEDGWLFTKEEFDVHEDADRKLAEKIDFVSGVQQYLAAKNISLVVAVVPAKARLYEYELGRYEYPSYKRPVYSRFLEGLRGRDVETVNLLNSMQAALPAGDLFLKTDTHWTPLGAQVAAHAIQPLASQELTSVEKEPFKTVPAGKVQRHEGDLLRYLPGGGPGPDILPIYETVSTQSSADIQNALFSEDIPPVTLVGTSYSANKSWNFEGYLKEALQADVLNAASEGQGPFVAMKEYLEGDTFRNTPPKLVIWEVPERYLTFSYDLKTAFYKGEGV